MVPPIVSSSLIAICIDACSNILSQYMRAYKEDRPFVFDRLFFCQYIFYVCMSAPANFCWQSFLERTFPGWKLERRKPGDDTHKEGDEVDLESLTKKRRDSKEWKRRSESGEVKDYDDSGYDDEQYVRVRNWRNIFKKWFTDCITMGAILNTTAFLAIFGAIKGHNLEQIKYDLRHETFTIISNSWKLWPPVNLISTTFIPVERRIVFLCCFGLIWHVYLSLVAARL